MFISTDYGLISIEPQKCVIIINTIGNNYMHFWHVFIYNMYIDQTYLQYLHYKHW